MDHILKTLRPPHAFQESDDLAEWASVAFGQYAMSFQKND
jgi:hypothetical protein